ncbi:putative disease resistance protein RGA4 [Macadamia integrifolia]|uniref:putative disease resistance protein RGA4 n=1 Tax=Macadamia integrifolia TaxID=60698 RepID=UPI001C4FEE41|nr:putative disease resistance protein RGA4 [Macadamia integrifolia]
MAHKIKNVNKVFDEIKRDMDSLNLVSLFVPTYLQNRKTMETFSFVDESEVVGRDDDKSKIASIITSSDNQDILMALPIVGMGGIGKTTLAKLVYNDGFVAKYFDKRIWVHVSKDFDVKKILIEITESVTKRTCQFSSIDVIQQSLKDELSEKRFLLVLDDMWNDDSEQWDMLKTSLKIGARNSKVIATTRIIEVASMIGTFDTYHLQSLSEDKCWSILKNKAFGNGGAEQTPNMVAIGKEIVKKCGGLPLAAKALGGLMHIKKDEQHWLSIKDNEIWDLPMDKNGVLPALKLSYDHLPSHLKQCFLYCSIFPKGAFIFRNDLIRQWMALGFLQPSTGSRLLMEDIGNIYINQLLWNSFFQDAEYDDFGLIKFKIHDLVFDLACSLSRPDNINVGAEGLKSNSNAFHLRLYSDGDIKKIQDYLSEVRNLRSLHLKFTGANTPIGRNVLDFLFKKLKCLRVLELSNCRIKDLPSSIKKLKHLRHLDLSFNPIEALPASITSLYNLQTLDLGNCPLKELPEDMRKLVKLRQLNVYREDGSLSQMPIDMGRLIYLNGLSTFIVGHKREQCIKELQRLDLRGNLGIYNLENVRSRTEAEEANLMGKEKLDMLHLSWRSNVLGGDNSFMLGNETVVDEDDVLEGLRPHPNLKQLIIKNFGGDNLPQWMMRVCELSLPKLVKFFLHDCERLEHVPPLGQLPSLKILHLKRLKRMKSLGSEFYHGDDSNGTQVSLTTTTFPSLEELSFEQLPNFEEWMEPQGSFPSFPRLGRMFLKDCPKLVTMPSRFPSFSKLYIFEMPKLKFLPKGLLHNNVKELNIVKCPDLEAIIMPNEEEGVQVISSSLDLLLVRNCPSLTSFPDVRGLHSIRRFIFIRNEKITGLPEGLHTLHTLELLWIGGYSSELESFPNLEHLQHLSSLRHLHIVGWSKLSSLPEQLQNLTQLEFLAIHEFHSVAALPEWLGNLSSLRTLGLVDCNNLMYLPEEEEGLRCFIKLEKLNILNCPLLEERCSRGRGEEWPKIKHIKNIQIDDQYV